MWLKDYFVESFWTSSGTGRLLDKGATVVVFLFARNRGAIAQLGERLPCTQEVGSSILPGSTNSIRLEKVERSGCIELVSVERRISIAI